MAEATRDQNWSLIGFTQRALILIGLFALAALLWTWRQVLVLASAAVIVAVLLNALAAPVAKHTPIGRKIAVGVAALLIVAGLGGALWLFY